VLKNLRRCRWLAMIAAGMLCPPHPFSLSSQESQPIVIVRMTDGMKFVPDRLTIHVGQTVKWLNEANEGGAAHTVTTDPEKVMDPKHVSIPEGAKPFDSGNINPGRSYLYTFRVPGVYRYACAPHEGMMRGEIMVEP